MKNITDVFKEVYLPQKALIIYRSQAGNENAYVEAYDMDGDGSPINAHPLSMLETAALAECLNASAELNRDFLVSRGILPDGVLHISSNTKGHAIWHTPAQRVNLLFKDNLSIPCGESSVPPMIWKASKTTLWVYALKASRRPNEKTPLYHAPFFNIHNDGAVCMGTVDIEIDGKCCLEDFMVGWQRYFWDSYFSHLISEASPVKGNIVQLWRELAGTEKQFPNEVLIKQRKTLKDLIV